MNPEAYYVPRCKLLLWKLCGLFQLRLVPCGIMKTAWGLVSVKTGDPLRQNNPCALMETAWGLVSVKTGDPLRQNNPCALMETAWGLVSVKTGALFRLRLGTLCGRTIPVP